MEKENIRTVQIDTKYGDIESIRLSSDGSRDDVVTVHALEGLGDSDKALIELGYKQELKREYGFFSVFSFSVSISGLFATIAGTFASPLMAGGAACVVWAWAIAGFGCICIAFSVAEIVSAYPTSGGLYYACSKVYPRQWAPLMCWVDGWLNLLGQIACTASTDYTGAQLLLSAVAMGTDFSYSPTAKHTVGVVSAILVLHGAINCLPTRYIEKFTKSYAIFHYLALVAGAIALLVKTHPKHDAGYVFTHVESNSGWSPLGWSFMFGFISVSWTMTDYDAPAHLCEEMKMPEIKAPWAISASTLFTYGLGFLYNIVLCFCMGNTQEIMQETLPLPMIYYNSLGKAGGIAFTVFMFVVINCVGASVLQSTSRTVWAQARDNMYPGASRFLYQVNKRTSTPINAVVVSTLICIAINLIALGSSQTINAIFNVTSIALDWSYCVPILGKRLFPQMFKRGPWHLDKFSPLVNWYAILWTLYASIIFFMPTELPATSENMNYAVVFFIFVIVASTILWLVIGSKVYKGPSSTAAMVG